jgi:hypothetical protein
LFASRIVNQNLGGLPRNRRDGAQQTPPSARANTPPSSPAVGPTSTSHSRRLDSDQPEVRPLFIAFSCPLGTAHDRLGRGAQSARSPGSSLAEPQPRLFLQILRPLRACCIGDPPRLGAPLTDSRKPESWKLQQAESRLAGCPQSFLAASVVVVCNTDRPPVPIDSRPYHLRPSDGAELLRDPTRPSLVPTVPFRRIRFLDSPVSVKLTYVKPSELLCRPPVLASCRALPRSATFRAPQLTQHTRDSLTCHWSSVQILYWVTLGSHSRSSDSCKIFLCTRHCGSHLSPLVRSSRHPSSSGPLGPVLLRFVVFDNSLLYSRSTL